MGGGIQESTADREAGMRWRLYFKERRGPKSAGASQGEGRRHRQEGGRPLQEEPEEGATAGGEGSTDAVGGVSVAREAE